MNCFFIDKSSWTKLRDLDKNNCVLYGWATLLLPVSTYLYHSMEYQGPCSIQLFVILILQGLQVLSTPEKLNLSLHIAVRIVLLLFFQKIRYFNRSHLGKIFRNGSHPSEIYTRTLQNLQRLGSFDVIVFQAKRYTTKKIKINTSFQKYLNLFRCY